MSTVSRVLEFEPPIDAEASVTRLLHALGEDPSREGLRRTPERVAKALEFLTSGRRLSPRDVLNGAVFNEAYEGMVLVKDIEFYSLCEHHLLPFHGRAHVAYLPAGKVIGLSKIPRLLEVFSRRLQVQERLTEQTAQALAEVLEPRGVAVMLEAVHFCMMMRGVEKQRSATSTFAYRGRFDSSPELRAEFLAAVREAEPVWESALRAAPTGGRHIELTAESRPEHVGRARGASRRAFRSAPGRPRGHRCGLCPAP